MSRTVRLLLDGAILVAYLVANNPSATGVPLHEWLSVGLALVIAVHVALNWEWVGHAARRLFTRLRAASRLNLVVDVVLFLSFITLMLSGLLISEAVLPALGLSTAHGGSWEWIHSLSAHLALGALAVHFGLHWRWIASAVKALVTRPSAAPVAEGVEL